MSKLFINAPNVHQGGGRTLLDALLEANSQEKKRVLILDSRMVLPDNYNGVSVIKRVFPSILQRFLAEFWLFRKVKEEDAVLCFGNLPPLFKLTGHVTVFIQNRYLLEDISLSDFPWKTRLHLNIERLWLRFRLSNADQLIVQTPSMRNMLISLVERKSKNFKDVSKNKINIDLIKILPFVNSAGIYQRNFIKSEQCIAKDFDFIYVASGDLHKNHRRLIEAWILLAVEGIFPSLCITVDEKHFPELSKWINEMVVYNDLKLENVGVVSHKDVIELYANSRALIYPSLTESFGLPLIEARQAGLYVLASELDYVRDVLDPDQSFNPSSAASISAAIKRFLQIDQLPLPLNSAEQFLTSTLKIIK